MARKIPMRMRSLVGLIPLFAVTTLDAEAIDKMPGFKRRMNWFIKHRPDLCGNIASITRHGQDERLLLSMVHPSRLQRVLATMLDENEFLSPHGIRGISRYHKDHPFILQVDGQEYRVVYEPAESTTGTVRRQFQLARPGLVSGELSDDRIAAALPSLFRRRIPGGISHRVRRDDEPGGRGGQLSRRLSRLFLRDEHGRRPVFGGAEKFQTDPHFRDHILFYEYFHGDNGAGLGASHQTGWTALVAKLLQQSGE